MTINDIKKKLFNSLDLNVEESSYIFNKIMSGEISEIDTSAILIALKIGKELFIFWLLINKDIFLYKFLLSKKPFFKRIDITGANNRIIPKFVFFLTFFFYFFNTFKNFFTKMIIILC